MLEIDGALHTAKGKSIPNAPELPPLLNSATPPTDTPPVYQDITGLSCKSKEVFNFY